MKAQELIDLSISYFERIEEMTHRLTSGNVSHLGATMKLYARDALKYLGMESEDSNFISTDYEYELIKKSIVWLHIIEDYSARLTTGNVSHNSRTIRGKAIRCREFLIKHRYDKE